MFVSDSQHHTNIQEKHRDSLLYTSDAADDTPCVDLGGRRIIKKTNSSKSKLADSFMFSKNKDEKKLKDKEQPETVVNKDSEALA